MNARVLSLAAALAGACVLSVTALGKDDPAKEKAARDALRKKLKDKKCFVYFDMSYYVDSTKLDSRWQVTDPPPFKDVKEEEGGQFFAQWIPNTGQAPGIEFKVQKFPFFKREGGKQSNFSLPFKSWGKSVDSSDTKGLAEGFYEDWIRECAEFQKDKSKPSKDKKMGVTDYFATAVGKEKQGGDGPLMHVRKNWWVWKTTGAKTPCSWVAEVTIAEKFIDTPEVLAMAEAMMKFTQEVPEK